MIRCRYCRTEMEKTYSFSGGEGKEFFRCPECGASTAEKPIAYGEDGMLPQKKKKKRSRAEESGTADETNNTQKKSDGEMSRGK